MFGTETLQDSKPVLAEPATLRSRALEEGYLFFRELVEPSVVLRLRRKVLEVCRRFGWLAEDAPLMEGVARGSIRVGAYDEPIWPAFQCEVLVLPEFVELGLHPEILNVLRNLFQEPVMPHRGDTCRAFSPGALDLATLPHQDHFYVRGTTDLWTVWIPLGDCPVEQGGLAVLTRSQRDGLLFHSAEGPGKEGVSVPENSIWSTMDYECGDVLMFNSLTVHRACVNSTKDRLRISADYRYQPSSQPTGKESV